MLPAQAALIPQQSVLVTTTLLERILHSASGIYRHFEYLLAKREATVSSREEICLALQSGSSGLLQKLGCCQAGDSQNQPEKQNECGEKKPKPHAWGEEKGEFALDRTNLMSVVQVSMKNTEAVRSSENSAAGAFSFPALGSNLSALGDFHFFQLHWAKFQLPEEGD